MSKKGKNRLIPAGTQPVTYQEDMAQRGTMFNDGEEAGLNQVAKKEATVGLLGLTNKTMNRQAFGQYFGEDLRAEFFENAMMLNNEGKLITEKFIENSQRYDQNPNARLAEPSMQIGNLVQSSSFEDQPPTMLLMQEKLIEKQQQAIEKDLVQKENFGQIYDVGALDWGRMPVNDLFNRSQFQIQKTGYQMNADGSISAVVKKENTKITPEEKKPKI
ncbi:MAG: hypothetical protein EZS28_041189, partial [Streblomastix strix]